MSTDENKTTTEETASQQTNDPKIESSLEKSPNTTFNEIIIDFTNFLSGHSVYEAAPENSKVLVFNSDLCFKEMIKAFINEDIYCALIYDSMKQIFISLVSISDILILFNYIIEKAKVKEITDFNYIKDVFSNKKSNNKKEEEEVNKNSSAKKYDILKYLDKINFNDYTKIKSGKKNHNLISVSLDSSLLEVVKIINKEGIHRLVVEETRKKHFQDSKKKEIEKSNKSLEKMEQSEENVNVLDKKLKSGSSSKANNSKLKSEKEEDSKENLEEKKVKKKKTIKKKKADDEENNLGSKENIDKESLETQQKTITKKKIKKKTEKNDSNNKESSGKTKTAKSKKNIHKKEIEIESDDEKNLNKNSEMKDNKKDDDEDNLETQNYTGFITYETIFDFFIFNYYSNEMREFNMTLNDLICMKNNKCFIEVYENYAITKDKVYLTYEKKIDGKNDLLPIFSENKTELFGFLFLRDYLFFISNCESDQNLTNEEFLVNMYEGIDDEKPYGKQRLILLELNDETKQIKIKEIFEKINISPEKKIIVFDKNNGNKVYLISLKSIFDTIINNLYINNNKD